MFRLENVTKRFGDTLAVDDLSVTTAPGQTTVLIGPSGCGKSTTLRLMNGLLWPDAGAVHFEGEAVTPESARRLRHQMGYVIQEGGLFPHLTARANVTLMARHLDWPAARCEDRLQELADLVRLPVTRLDAYPAQLSGGQRQRVSLMRALMLDPDALLLDEPLGSLDPMIRADLQDDLRDIFRTLQKTVVLVTHDIGEAGFFGDQILLLREGRLVQRGTLRDLVQRPAEPFVEAFVNAQRSPLDSLHADA
jgi:osmoprotectant transport system ATP-binding protein